MLSDLHKGFREKKGLRVVCSKQLHGINDIKELSGKWLNSVFQPCCFLWLCASHFFLFTAVKTIPRQKIFYNVKSQTISKNTLYYAKHGVFLHSGSPRKFFFHFTVRIVVSALVTIRIVLVSFYKQYCAVFSAKKNS